MTFDHLCGCRNCDPALKPAGEERTSERHMGVHFGDGGFDAFRNGVKVSRCVEAMAGLQGWVIEVRDPLHVCRWCGQELCQRLVRGVVELQVYRPGYYAGWYAAASAIHAAMLEERDAYAAVQLAMQRAGLTT